MRKREERLMHRVKRSAILHPVASLLIMGTRKDEGSSLYVLRGISRHLLPLIWRFYVRAVRGGIIVEDEVSNDRSQQQLFACPIAFVKFPAPDPEGVCVNMLPFRLDDITTLPPGLKRYWGLIQACPVEAKRAHSVAYLTVHESVVPAQTTQRKPGLHTEGAWEMVDSGKGTMTTWIAWGGGTRYSTRCTGGVYMASTVGQKCVVFHAQLDKKVIGLHGSAEHMRAFLCESGCRYSLCKSNELWWLTDR